MRSPARLPLTLVLLASAAGCGGGGDTVTLDVTQAYGFASGKRTTITPEESPYLRADLLVAGDPAMRILGTYEGGRLTFEGVPGGENVLELATAPADPRFPDDLPHVLQTPQSRRNVSFRERHWYRADVQRTYDEVLVDLSAGGFSPWEGDDTLLLVSRNTNLVRQLLWFGPDEGETWVTDASFDVGDARVLDGMSGVPLLEAQDDFTLVQLRKERAPFGGSFPAWDPYHVAEVERAVTVADAMTQPWVEGEASPASAGLAPARTTSHTIDFRGSTYRSLRTALGLPDAAYADVTFEIVHEPGQGEDFFIGTAPPIWSFESGYTSGMPVNAACYPDYDGNCDETACPDGCDDATTGLLDPGDLGATIEVPHPYTTAGTEMLEVTYSYYVPWQHPTTGTVKSLLAYAYTFTRLGRTNGRPIELELGPPRDIRIGGMAVPLPSGGASTSTAGVGLTPTITFEPPSTGRAEYYQIEVIELENTTPVGGGTVRRTRNVARMRTFGTSARIPNDVLVAGRHYYVRVAAVSDGRDLQNHREMPRDVPHRWTAAPSGVFTP